MSDKPQWMLDKMLKKHDSFNLIFALKIVVAMQLLRKLQRLNSYTPLEYSSWLGTYCAFINMLMNTESIYIFE